MPEQETLLRLSIFFGVLLLMLGLERLLPRRAAPDHRRRWPANLGMALLSSLLLRLLFPIAAAGVALMAEERGLGLLNLVDMPHWARFALALLALDFLIWLQHLVFHKIPILWRLHLMHHSDPALDATTGIRFHPLEILLSMLIKMAAVLALGAPAPAVMAFEILLNATAMFNHANIDVPRRLDRWLRLALVTPDFHLVHHSVIRAEHDGNYGFNLPWWDYLFGTYKAAPSAGRDRMEIGLRDWRSATGPGFFAMLLLPFGGKTGR